MIATALVALAAASATSPAFAAKNVGSHIDAAEFNEIGESCTTYLNYYSENMKKLQGAKTKDARATARDNVNWAINKGYGMGCAWVGGV
jgi:hypothetical protein